MLSRENNKHDGYHTMAHMYYRNFKKRCTAPNATPFRLWLG